MTYLLGQIFALALGIGLLSFGLGWLVKELSLKKEDVTSMETKKNIAQGAIEKVGESVRDQLSEQFNKQSSQIQNHLKELHQILSTKWPNRETETPAAHYGAEAQARMQQIQSQTPPPVVSAESKRLLEQQIQILERKYDNLQGQFQTALKDIESRIHNNLSQIDQRVGAWYTPVLRQLNEIKEMVANKKGPAESAVPGAKSNLEKQALLRMAWNQADDKSTEDDASSDETESSEAIELEVDSAQEHDGDNLRALYGVGPYVDKVFRETFNITTYKQVAELSQKQVREIEKCLFFREPFSRHNWQEQAEKLYLAKKKLA